MARTYSKVQSSLFQSVICSAVASLILGLIISCGGGSRIGNIVPGIPGAKAVIRVVHTGRSAAHVFPPSGTSKPYEASLLFQAAPAASQLQQSFEEACDFDATFISTVPSGSIIPLGVSNSATAPTQCNASDTGPQDVSFPPLRRSPQVFFSGTLTSLVVSGVTQSGVQLRCVDQTSTAAVADKDPIISYFRPSDGAVLLFDNTTQLPFTCNLSVPAGDPLAHISAQWAKI